MNAPSGYQRLLAWLAIGAIIYHLLAILFLHGLEPDVDPLVDQVGAYLRGQYQPLARTTFLALACALSALGLGLRTYLPSGMPSRITIVLLVAAVVGFLGVSAAPEYARYFAIPTQPAAVLTIVMLSFLLRRQRRWQPVGAILMTIGAVLAVLYVATVVLGITVALGLGGLANRIVLVLIYTWVVLVSRGLLVESPLGVQTR